MTSPKSKLERDHTRRCGDYRVFPGQRRGTFMRDWRRGGYKNHHRWGIGFHRNLESWRGVRMTDSQSSRKRELLKIAADLKSGTIVFALGSSYPDYQLTHETAKLVGELIESTLSETRRWISGIKLVKMFRDQRDEVADVLRRFTQWDQFDALMNIAADGPFWRNRFKEVLEKCPSYEQQLQNVCDGLGITRDQLFDALAERKSD